MLLSESGHAWHGTLPSADPDSPVNQWHGARARWLATGIVLPFLAAGCLYTVRSTSGGRKEARRECLASARGSGYTVLDLSAAKWLGAGKHEVLLTVERGGVSQPTLRCVYDQRDRLVDLQIPTVR